MGLFTNHLGSKNVRKSPRHALHFPVYIMAADPTWRHSCMLHDLSEGGARLTVGPRNDIPDNFTLVFSRNCRVVRRTDGQIGVEFISAEF